MNKKILIIGAGWEQVPMIKKAKAMGLYVIATNPLANAAGFEFSDEHIVVDPRDLFAMEKIVKEHQIQAVVSDNCDYSLFACAVLGRLFNLPATSIEAAQLTTNKFNMRDRCSKFGIVQPEFRLCKTLEEAKQAIAEIGFPVVFKPVDNRGSFGVKILFNDQNLEQYFLHSLINSHSRYILVEKYIEGINLTVDGYAFPEGHINVGIASKKVWLTPENKPITQEVIYPAEISPDSFEKVLANNQKVVQALNIKQGATHAEYMLTENGDIYLLEIANRGGGVMTSQSIIPAISGVDIPELLLKESLGLEIKKPEGFDIYNNRSSVLHFFVFEKRGKIKVLEREDLNTIQNDLLHFMFLIKPGDVIKSVESGADRHGFLIMVGDSREDARAKAKQVVANVKLEIE
ncbi:MAG: ATP-grasp domain-containing protein [Candidatus Pacebacteria bacterium]|nr:ATP-grasp domain-containing protein [Candidatus Paceibacterota bacterium]